MRRLLKLLAAAVLVLIIAVAVAFLLIGGDRLWELAGPADQGEVDFATLQRRETPNDALACLPQFCAAKADVEAPVIARPFGDVFLAVQNAVAKEPDLEQVAADPGQGTLRYVQRSKLLRFPDTVNVKVVPMADGGAAVLLYSRSQIGRGDLGVNRARIERWIGLIKAAAQK